MSPLVEIRPATFRDALVLPLSRADRDEVEALTTRNPREVLVESVENSSLAWAGLVDGDLVCLFGVVPVSLAGVTGVPWLLGSDLVQTYARIFLRLNKAYLPRMLAEFPVLRNVVHARHPRAVRWLRWLGFTLGDAIPLGPRGELFHPFEMRAS